MSYVKFDEEAQQERVFILPVKKLPPNPHIALAIEPLWHALAAPSETSDADSERPVEPPDVKRLRHELIASDQMSFLTGSASADLQAAHLINAVRSNTLRKLQVEACLTRQRLQDSSLSDMYSLDGPGNAILLEASLHVHWDLYGTFCIVPSESDVKDMLDALIAVNTEWAQKGPFQHQMRPLDITQPPFANPRWEIILLHPQLPRRQGLLIAGDRTFYVPSQPLPQRDSTCTPWIAYDDHLRMATPPHDPLPPFIAENVRSALKIPALSSLAMVINAHYKLSQFIREYDSIASPRVRHFTEQVSRLVTPIFYVPPRYGLGNQAMEFFRASQTSVSRHAARDDLGGSSSAYGLIGTASSPGDNLASDAVIPPEAVAEDGLTDTEFQIVASRSGDPLLDPIERADAAMLLLFGTRRCANPYTPS